MIFAPVFQREKKYIELQVISLQEDENLWEDMYCKVIARNDRRL